jgi:hypothetical protein
MYCRLCGAVTPCGCPAGRRSERSKDAHGSNHLALAHAINGGDTEEGKAIRAHLITMGWRPPT